MTLPATFYAAGSSQAVPVELHLDDETLRIESMQVNRVEQVRDCPLSEPLGRMPRRFSLPDGAQVEIMAAGELAEWEKQHGRRSGMHLVHQLESRWRWVAAAVAFMLAFTAGLYVWGLPFAAKRIALNLPTRFGKMATDQAHMIITHMLDFSPSELPQ